MPGLRVPAGFVRRHRSAIASWAALGVAATSLVVYAVNSQGFPAHKAELNDGGVWVTNQHIGALGRQNVPIGQLDSLAWAGKQVSEVSGLDVLQNGAAVVSYDPAGTLTPIDVTLGATVPDQQVSIKGVPAIGGNVVTVVDPKTGSLWATHVDPATGQGSLAGVSGDARRLATVGADASATVAVDGTVVAASSARKSVTTVPALDGTFGAPERSSLTATPEGGIAEITAVGDTAVVLDGSGRLLTSKRVVDVADGARLQQAGPAADQVLVATKDALEAVTLSSGSRRVVRKSEWAGEQPGRPVRLGSCDWAVWSTSGSAHVVTGCDGAAPTVAAVPDVGPSPDMVFRVNRNQLVLNDVASGAVWRIDGSTAQKISDWDALQKTQDDKNLADPNPEQQAKQTPPIAKPDDLGVRPGRTTVLHVLDNDEAATSAILAITNLDTRGLPDGVSVQVAPDRQSLLATVAPSVGASDYGFGYTIDDGSSSAKSTAEGKVTLHVRTDGDVGKPELRPNYAEPQYYVVANKSVEIPVSPDWRDRTYGDPVAISDVHTDLGGTVAMTPQGLLKFTAPPEISAPQTAKVTYSASTGGDKAAGSVRVTLVPDGLKNAKPAQANPDAAAGQVGGAIVIHPLDNDIPGADPNTPDAQLKLAGNVAPVHGQPVETDREAGTVTMRPTQAGNYVLSYGAAFGSASMATSQIRVTVFPKTSDAAVPVAGPDTATIRGQSPTTVDVLANDVDPQGGMLAVTSARPTDPDSRLRVAVIDGRWIRVSAMDPALVPPVQAVQYVVSNGSAEATGSLTVTQEPPLEADQNAPVTETDEVTVRAGTTVDIPVLDNDSTPSGDPVALAPAPADNGLPRGRYPVFGSPERDPGQAYLSGRRVHYVAPKADGKGGDKIRIEYTAINTGDTEAPASTGTVIVDVVPPVDDKLNPDQAPTPRTLEARVVQGDTTTVRLPPLGLDPDGDPVTIVGVGDVEHGAPRLGRLVSTTGGAITYQAFPGVSGTDKFGYIVEDPSGKRGVGIVQIAVVPPGPPQPPVALDDLVTADAGREVSLDVLANDLRTPGTTLTVEPLRGQSSDVKLDAETGVITLHASKENNKVVEVPYTATNGIDSDNAVLRVRTQKDYDNPPTAEDVLVRADAGAKEVTVDLAKHVSDIDDATSELTFKPGAGATLVGTTVRIPVTNKPQTIPYEVVDHAGAVAAAVIRVPARPAGTPYLKDGAHIEVQPGKSTTVNLADLVEDPEGDSVVLTTLAADALYGAPRGALDVSASGTTLKVVAGPKPGPASVTFTVSDRPKLADPDAHVVTLTVPVQVGDDKPVVTCPGEPLQVAEGGRDLLIDVASVCHVWTSQPAAAASLKFSGSWAKAVPGVSLSNTDGRIKLHTGTDARPPATGQIAVAVAGQPASATLNVEVTKLPPPTLPTINVDGHAGKPTRVDVAKYLRTKVSTDARDVQIMAVTPQGTAPASVTKKGSVLTLTPQADKFGVMQFRVEVSDLGVKSTRRAVGLVRLSVAARPSAPSGLVAGQDMLSNTVMLNWRPSSANGARVTSYVVKYSSSKKSGQYPCAASPCRVTGLPNGVEYTFQVKAVNVEGESDWSNTARAQPDQVPNPVVGLSVVKQRDGQVSLSWSKPLAGDYGPVDSYVVIWPGRSESVTATEATAQVPANGQDYTFVVMAHNKKGNGPAATITGMGAGKPETPAKPTFDLQDRPGNRKAVVVQWGPVDPNGPAPVQYQVLRQGAAAPICSWQTATTCADDLPLDGATYSYTVTARNAEETSPRESGSPGFHVSAASPPGTVESASTPDAMSISSYVATGSDQEVRVAFTSGASHGATNRVECTVNGSTCPNSPWSYAVTGASDTRQFKTSVPNGSTATIQLRACNGSSGSSQTGAQCSAWVSKQTTPYGPIGTPTIHATAGASSIDVTASWDANGKPVNVVITRNGTTIKSFSNTGSNPSYSFNDPVGTSYTGNYVITVSDTGLWPGQTSPRASRSDGPATATTPPPPPSVTLSKGPACGGGGGSACPGTCTDPSCAYLHLELRNFPGSVSCIPDSTVTSGPAYSSKTLPGNYSGEPGWFFGYSGKQVWVTCGTYKSNVITW